MNILIPWIAIFCFSLGLSVVGMYFQRKEKERRAAQKMAEAAAEAQRMAETAFIDFKASVAQATQPPEQEKQLGRYIKEEKQGQVGRIH
jgi:hypothetical protein